MPEVAVYSTVEPVFKVGVDTVVSSPVKLKTPDTEKVGEAVRL